MAIGFDGEEKYYWEETEEFPTYESAVEALKDCRAAAEIYLSAANTYASAADKHREAGAMWSMGVEKAREAGDTELAVELLYKGSDSYKDATRNYNKATDCAEKSTAAILQAEDIENIIVKNRRVVNPGRAANPGYGRRR